MVGRACNGAGGSKATRKDGKSLLCHVCWGPTVHPPTIHYLSVCMSIHTPNYVFIHPYILMCIHSSTHPPAHEFKHHPLPDLLNPSTLMSINVSVCPCPPHPFISPSILPYKPILCIFLSICPFICLSVRASLNLLLICFIVRTTHYEAIMLTSAHAVAQAVPDATTAFPTPFLSMTPRLCKRSQGPVYPRLLYLRRLTLFLHFNGHVFSSQASGQGLYSRHCL